MKKILSVLFTSFVGAIIGAVISGYFTFLLLFTVGIIDTEFINFSLIGDDGAYLLFLIPTTLVISLIIGGVTFYKFYKYAYKSQIDIYGLRQLVTVNSTFLYLFKVFILILVLHIFIVFIIDLLVNDRNLQEKVTGIGLIITAITLISLLANHVFRKNNTIK